MIISLLVSIIIKIDHDDVFISHNLGEPADCSHDLISSWSSKVKDEDFHKNKKNLSTP